MRLTLRTLLAWLDDTLTPSEVREIGKQVTESPFARELVDRIHRVTRQRRLAVPGTSGPDATDPNVVAAYLDSELAPDEVSEFEKRCLTSDVHLAEVASVHQILSLLGQKAKVPAEARHRMYRLVKGRETVGVHRPRPLVSEAREPVTQPIPQWVTPDLPMRPWAERYGPMAAVLGLISVLLLSSWWSLTPDRLPAATPPLASLPVVAAVAPKAQAELARVNPPGEPKAAEAVPKPEAGAPAPPVLAEAGRPAAGANVSDKLPAGVSGMVGKFDGVVLRKAGEGSDWARVAPEAALRGPETLVNLTPGQTPVRLGKARVDLAGPSEVRLTPPTADEPARVDLIQGRVVARLEEPDATLAVEAGATRIVFKANRPTSIGLERPGPIGLIEIGGTGPLVAYVADGEVSITMGDQKATVAGPKLLTFRGAAGEAEEGDAPTPDWVLATTPSPLDRQVGDAFARYFKDLKDDGALLKSLVEPLSEDDATPEVRQLAIRGLGLLGMIDLVLPELGHPKAPEARRAAISVLRGYLARSRASADRLRGELRTYFGDESARSIEKLLAGYTPAEAREEATFSKLVGMLGLQGQDNLPVRQLALENLRLLTGRDDLQYDPEHPEGPGLRAWQEALAQKKLAPVAVPTGTHRLN